MAVVLDPNAGPCSGVKRALRLIEEQLTLEKNVIALGQVIHNQAEIERLESMGLESIDQNSVENVNLGRLKDKKVFVRSHGISKKLYQKLIDAGSQICDGTCPTVAAVQKKVARFYQNGYQIFIVGKAMHPEVLGLCGACEDQAILIQSIDDIESVEFNDKALLVAQTTLAYDKFLAIKEKILQIAPHVIVKDTICRQVSNRHENMRNFAAGVDVVLLVGGKNSSNTRVLFDIAKQSNPHTFWIERQEEIKSTWLDAHSIGITGSASTPLWQLQRVKAYVERITNH